MIYVVLFLFLLAFVTLFIDPHKFSKHTWGLVVPIAGVFIFFCSYYPVISSGQTLTFDYVWVESLGVSLSFYLDGLSWFFVLLVLSFGALVAWYAQGYMHGQGHLNRFYAYLLLFMAAMLGVVLSANLITLFVFWELTSFSSYLLIGHKHEDEGTREAARQALLTTGFGGLAMLAGFVLLGVHGGSYSIPGLLSNSLIDNGQPWVYWSACLVLLGAFTKSAQFPFHFWLPGAMQAPTPVSAYLHSATMVKAGVYLVFRFTPIFQQVDLWNHALLIAGGVTAIIGSLVAFKADDLKIILAYTTIGALGLFFMMTGLGTTKAIQGALVYLLAHAMYKGSLFMIAGTLDHQCGTRKISALSGMVLRMPFLRTAAILSVLSLAGIIPFLGFVGKEMLLEGLPLGSGPYVYFPLAVLVISGAFFTAVGIKIIYTVFYLPRSKDGITVNEASVDMYGPPLVLGLGGLIFGLFSSSLTNELLKAGTAAISLHAAGLHLSVWHGFNLALGISVMTMTVGLLLFLIDRSQFARGLSFIKPLKHIAEYPQRIYTGAISSLMRLATWVTGAVQNGYLRNYIAIYLVIFSVLITYYLWDSLLLLPPVNWAQDMGMLKIYEVAILILIMIVLSFIFISRSRLTIIASIGIVGYAIAFAYTVFSAPDVAITQFLAETLGLILLAVILPRLPKLKVSDLAIKFKYTLVSVIFGLIMGIVTYVCMSYESLSGLKQYFIEQSVPKGKGENVVNVILVDFRALDTLGEISVLVITMIGIMSFMKVKSQDTL